MIRAVMIDDEPNNNQTLQKLLEEYCPDVTIVGSALSAADARIVLAQQKPELVFLDVEMPVENGFDLLKSLPHKDFDLIFITAHNQYGIDAIKFAAVDYLLKPLNIQELISAIEKVKIRSTLKKQHLLIENLLQIVQSRDRLQEHRIALPTNKETRFVNPSEIIRCESNNSYTYFYLSDGEKLLISKPIYEYDELLSRYGFIRCHQSHLVNHRFIRSWIKEGNGFLLLQDQTEIPVSRQKKEFVKAEIERLSK